MKCEPQSLNAICGVLVAAFVGCDFQASAANLLPFPLSANQRSAVRCLENPMVSYDVYLPPAYSTNGPALPILYTFSPGGGGMVNDLRLTCRRLNIICVGILGSQNYGSWDLITRESAAVTRDIRRRVLFDPTAEFAGGFSGGGLVAYMFSRFRAQHVAGVFAMAGWLGRGAGYPTYQTTDRVLTNLLVARARGLSDYGDWIMTPDSNYLTSCGAAIHDEYFVGGHEVPLDPVKSNCLAWLVSQRIPAGTNDPANASVQAAVWRTRIAAGEKETVLRECVRALNLARGAGDLTLLVPFDGARYRSALKALTGITGVNGDRAGDIRDLLQKYSYPAPILRCSADAVPGRMNLWFSKDTPGLDCFLEGRSHLVTDPWQQMVLPVLDTNTVWSAQFDLPRDATNGFYRLRTSPAPASSPPWPPN